MKILQVAFLLLFNYLDSLPKLYHVYLLESEDGMTVRKTKIPEIFSDQEETDTRVILYCAPKQGYETVRIRSPESDIFFILLHHASKFDIKILFDTGLGTTES